MRRRFLFGSNLKMHQTAVQSRDFVARLGGLVGDLDDVELFLLPPFTSLPSLAGFGAELGIRIGAQTVHEEAEGAYTGEISALMLAALEVRLVMVGHAERRTLFGESDDAVGRKLDAVLSAGMTGLLCVGETLAERRAGRTDEILARQLEAALVHVPPDAAGRLLVAYEPVWSIGVAGLPACVADIEPAAGQIRALLRRQLGAAAPEVGLLYGGSVTAGNAADYAAIADIDGLFVGRAAWTPEGFADVLGRSLAAWRQRPAS